MLYSVIGYIVIGQTNKHFRSNLEVTNICSNLTKCNSGMLCIVHIEITPWKK